MAPVIDLRSDTVTRPTPAMREAIATADVGDDVYGEDPTLNRLQELAAEVLGKEAALFVPSGSMANQIAIAINTQPGDEVMVGQGSHSRLFESGAAAAISGVSVRMLPGDGRFAAADVAAGINPPDDHFARTSMVAVENTHNMGGGVVWDREELSGVASAARAAGLATHFDGARLWNAAAAGGVAEAELAAGFDTVSVCLSKGLGAPVGSLIAGTAEMMVRAHRVRKRLGGGMRQAGILAAAGIHAIEHHRVRLVEDHANARAIAERLDGVAGLAVALARVHTNIVMVDVDPDLGSAAEIVAAAAAEHDVLFFDVGPQRLRLVTHLDVDAAECERAAEVVAAVAAR